MGEGFLADEDGDEFGFGQLHHGKTRYRLRETIPAAVLIVGDGKTEPFAHEVDVALDRLRRNLDVGGQPVAVWEFPGLDGLKNLLHPVQRRPGEQGTGSEG